MLKLKASDKTIIKNWLMYNFLIKMIMFFLFLNKIVKI